jgi:hypothetical protein
MKAVKERGSSGNPLSLVRALIMKFLSFECVLLTKPLFICLSAHCFALRICALENPGKKIASARDFVLVSLIIGSRIKLGREHLMRTQTEFSHISSAQIIPTSVLVVASEYNLHAGCKRLRRVDFFVNTHIHPGA